MSMNLVCDEIELRQTPTYITYMCYSNGDGGWEGILYRYKEWVKSFTNGRWPSRSELEEVRGWMNDHLSDLDEAAKKHGKLTFSIF